MSTKNGTKRCLEHVPMLGKKHMRFSNTFAATLPAVDRVLYEVLSMFPMELVRLVRGWWLHEVKSADAKPGAVAYQDLESLPDGRLKGIVRAGLDKGCSTASGILSREGVFLEGVVRSKAGWQFDKKTGTFSADEKQPKRDFVVDKNEEGDIALFDSDADKIAAKMLQPWNGAAIFDERTCRGMFHGARLWGPRCMLDNWTQTQVGEFKDGRFVHGTVYFREAVNQVIFIHGDVKVSEETGAKCIQGIAGGKHKRSCMQGVFDLKTRYPIGPFESYESQDKDAVRRRGVFNTVGNKHYFTGLKLYAKSGMMISTEAAVTDGDVIMYHNAVTGEARVMESELMLKFLPRLRCPSCRQRYEKMRLQAVAFVADASNLPVFIESE